MEEQNLEYDQLPSAITERLENADRAVVIASPATDRAVLNHAAEHFSARPRRRNWAVPAAVAASVILALFVLRSTGVFGPNPVSTDDIDGSGRVDILDVFALARMSADASLDSQADIDSLAARIVSLSPGAL